MNFVTRVLFSLYILENKKLTIHDLFREDEKTSTLYISNALSFEFLWKFAL